MRQTLLYTIKKLLWTVPILVGITFLAFGLGLIARGDPATNRVGDKVHSFHLEDGLHRITPGMFDYDALMFDNYQIKVAYLAGPDRKQMNPHMKNYGKLDGDSITLLTAMVNGCGTVMEMMYETGFSNKKVYRKVLDLYKKGYITCDDRSKTKVYSLTPDQEMMFINTSEMD